MGAWGAGIYDNDDAADWSAEVGERGFSAVEAALDAVLGVDHVEAPDGTYALAAADVVARLASGRGEDSPYCEDIVNWVEANAGAPADSLIVKAQQAVERVRGNDSELAELWSENASSVTEWLATLADIEQRLRS